MQLASNYPSRPPHRPPAGELYEVHQRSPRLTHSNRRLSSPSRKRTRDEGEDELEYADEEEPRAGSPGRDAKRPRMGSRETSTAPPSPSPKGKDKGKGRALILEDSYTLPLLSSSFHMPPPPIPRFGPKDRCNVHPVYKPAVPRYEPPQPSSTEDGEQPGRGDGGHTPPSNEGGDSDGGPEPNQGEERGGNDGQEQTGEDEGGNDGGHDQNTTQTPRGAPPPVNVQPGGPQRGDPWQVLRYDRASFEGYALMDHSRMASDLKRPVNWSMVGAQHPKSMSYREWDDELEAQNPWHQGGRPILE